MDMFHDWQLSLFYTLSLTSLQQAYQGFPKDDSTKATKQNFLFFPRLFLQLAVATVDVENKCMFALISKSTFKPF